MKQRFRIGKISFQDPLILCGAFAILLYFDASGFLRVGLLAAVLHEMGHMMAYLFLRHRFPHIEVTMTGFCMKTREEHFSANEQLLLAAAGLFHRLAHGLAADCVPQPVPDAPAAGGTPCRPQRGGMGRHSRAGVRFGRR